MKPGKVHVFSVDTRVTDRIDSGSDDEPRNNGLTWCKKRQSCTTTTGWVGGKRNAVAGQAP